MKKYSVNLLNKDNDDQDRQQYLLDTVEATRKFIKTGSETELYKNFVLKEDEMRERARSMCDEIDIRQRLYGNLSEELIPLINKINSDTRKRKKDEVIEIVENFSSQMIHTTTTFFLDELEKMAYLGYLNALYELHDKENEERREEQEFLRINQEIPYMATVSMKIEINRRIYYNEVPEKCDISEDSMERLFTLAKSYFIISRHKEPQRRFVSLSQKGKRFLEFVHSKNNVITRDVAEEYIKLTSQSIFNSLQTSIRCELPCDIQVHGVLPQTERKLKYEYRQTVTEIYKIIQRKNEYYSIESEIFFESPKKISTSEGGSYEIRIPKSNT